MLCPSAASLATMEGSQHAALQGFLALAKTTRGRAAAALVHNCIAKPGVVVFGELLQQPNIAALKGSEHQAAFDMLQLFAYGTYDDYKANPSKYPALTPAQITKLRQLTIVSAASTKKSLPYDELQARLDIPDVRTLEDLVISCIYAHLIQGKLNHRDRVVHVSSAAGRDVRPQSLDAMIDALGAWESKADALLSSIDTAIANAEKAKAEEAKEKANTDAVVEGLRKDVMSAAAPSSGMNAPGPWPQPHAASAYNPDEATRRGRPKRRHAQVTSGSKRF